MNVRYQIPMLYLPFQYNDFILIHFSIYGGFLIDGIGSCAFGLDINSQETENDPFLINAKDIFKFRFTFAIVVMRKYTVYCLIITIIKHTG